MIPEFTNEIIDIEKHSEKESYAGVCDDPNLGVTLIFYLQNVCDYLFYKVSKAMQERGWILLAMEMSETPSRVYQVSNLDLKDDFVFV